ncbi:MAG: hypothetical protein HQL26_02305 [Candidatus Omnitrophica bacterium]|nr:hypothetical protein [Candidatus Omnitrophota bacterium]
MMRNRALSPILVDFDSFPRPLNWPEIFGRPGKIVVEIGFGMGEVLIREAGKDPQVNFIGIEEHWTRITRTMTGISRQQGVVGGLDNIRILKLDAWVAFERLFSPQSIDHIFCLFPCPWPKEKHEKHRLFSQKFLRLVNSRLKTGAALRIVTDFRPFYDWVLSQNVDAGFASAVTATLEPQFNTKFEKKWAAQGQEKFFEIILEKQKHIEVPVEEDKELKVYKLKNFDHKKFVFQDHIGEVTVILKGFFYDAEQEKALVQLLVAEEQITQYFWAMIGKRKNDWFLQKVEGQRFFATPGITLALDLVYQAVEKIA